ncbi:HOG (high osmolarity glycerol) pathway protein [Cytospora paraplurivora]|uniref:HOG (High osmolarity glycerol) pathway protein n=1 Tax=Cytospora paraplurivora TaxID=2898453 RepID=A0AAN9U8K8_9PEZI
MTTPASESRRLSDASWEGKTSWDTGAWESLGKVDHLAPIYLGDGPPWSEDDDLQSPVVSSRHRKHKSTGAAFLHSRRRSSRDQGGSNVMHAEHWDDERGYYVGTRGDGSERYYVNQGEEANGPGGEYVTYPPNQARHSRSYSMAELQPTQYAEPNGDYHDESEESSLAESPEYPEEDQSRYSRDYQFTITSPDEEMHGKAVALFDFERENENELPLVEGQIIWVSYRHGQGWLVAEDPKTQESGLVPEEYVRLLRDIEGGMTSLTGQAEPLSGSPGDGGTPTQAEQTSFGHSPSASGSSNTNGYHQPVVSTFSTSSKDLEPYPQHKLGTQSGQAPPQVVHYHGQRGGSQANTPTLTSHQETEFSQRGSQGGEEIPAKKYEGQTMPDGKMQSPTEVDTLELGP